MIKDNVQRLLAAAYGTTIVIFHLLYYRKYKLLYLTLLTLLIYMYFDMAKLREFGQFNYTKPLYFPFHLRHLNDAQTSMLCTLR